MNFTSDATPSHLNAAYKIIKAIFVPPLLYLKKITISKVYLHSQPHGVPVEGDQGSITPLMNVSEQPQHVHQ